MDRTAWIAIILSICGLFAWQWYYQREYAESLRQQAEQASTKPPSAQISKPAATNQDSNTSADIEQAFSATDTTSKATDLPSNPERAGDVDIALPVEENTDTGATGEGDNDAAESTSPVRDTEFRSDDLLFGLTNIGGGISRVELLGHTVSEDTFVTINKFGKTPIGAVGMRPGEFEAGYYDMSVDKSRRQVIFHRESESGLRIEKVFSLPADDAKNAAMHTVQLTITFANAGEKRLRNKSYYVNLGSLAPVHELDLSLYSGFDYFSQGKDRFIDVNWFQASRVPLLGFQIRAARPEFLEEAPGLTWGAVKNQYFSTVLSIDDRDGIGVWAKRFEVSLNEKSEKTHPAIAAALKLPGFDLAPGEKVTRTFTLYVGPNRYSWLKTLGAGQEVVLRYGIFKPVSLALLSGLEIFHNVLAGSYALAIIMLTLAIKLALWPLQNKATKSMRRMAALSPKMTELREKYKDDPTRMNQELMKLYKDYGVNPFGGCLPMLIQIPIFFGFYSMLRSSVELRNSSFLWISDLSQPDTIFHLFGMIPINPLPLIMAATMFWQMRITPKTGDSVQQRIFLFMPLIFLVFCYNFAAALSLYWTVSNLFSIVQLYLTRDQPMPAMRKVENAAIDNPALGMKQSRKKASKRGGR